MLTATRRGAQHRLLVTVFLLAPAAATAASLGQFDDVDVRLDTTLRETTDFRLAPPDTEVLSDINADDGDRAFMPGLVSARTDITADLSGRRGDWGFDVSAQAWYDLVYYRSTADHDAATFNPVSVPVGTFPAETRRLMGANAEPTNAFTQDRFEVAGMPVFVRLGRQTLLWGESLFFASNGIAAGQAPVDEIKSLGAPLAPARELFLPVTQAMARVELGGGMALEAYDQLEWRRDRLPGVASYFSTTDILDDGGERLLLPGGGALYRTLDETPHGIGQFGVALRSQGGVADFGLYALRYDAKLPVPIYSLAAPTYHLLFPRNVQALGASISTYAGESNLAAEFSLRRNMPLLAGGPTSVSVAGSAGGIYAAAYQPAGSVSAPAFSYPRNGGEDAYAAGTTWQGQVSLVSQLAPSRWWHSASLQGEIAANDLLAITADHAAVVPGRTHFAAALRAVFTPQYFQVLQGLDLSFPLGLGYSLAGRSSLDASMYEGAGDVTLSIAATYHQVWQTALVVTHFIGGATAQRLADRDFVSLSLARTF